MINTKKILTYSKLLSENNNKIWMHEHQVDKKNTITEFESLVEEVELQISKFDNSIPFTPANKLTFKFVRDTRFSNDKAPYNPTFRAHISTNGKMPIPVGYYISIKSNNQSFIGGGLFASMFKDATKKVRDYIYTNPKEFTRIITKKDFIDNFEVMGEKLKRVPKEYDCDLEIAEYLKHKNWYLEYRLADFEIEDSEKIIELMIEKFKLMKEFNAFLNKALIGFEMPKRKR